MKRNRLLLAAAAIAAAVVIVVIVIVVFGSGKKSDTTTSSSTSSTAIFARVPQHGDRLGRLSAPATMTVFEDPQCPFCRQWNLDTLPTVVDRYVKTGKLKILYRGIQIIGPNSVQGLVAIYAAGQQNKLWNMADELYRRQGTENGGWITDALIGKAAGAAGVDRARLFTASSSGAVPVAMTEARRQANLYAVRGTPTFVIERTTAGVPKQLSVTALDPATFTAALDAALR